MKKALKEQQKLSSKIDYVPKWEHIKIEVPDNRYIDGVFYVDIYVDPKTRKPRSSRDAGLLKKYKHLV